MLLANVSSSEPPPRCVVRIRTSCWFDRSGIHFKKDIVFLKRKSSGYQFFEEDVQMVGAEEVLNRCVDIFNLKDGIYEVYTVNERSDWETPHIIDDYDYAFKPYVEIKE